LAADAMPLLRAPPASSLYLRRVRDAKARPSVDEQRPPSVVGWLEMPKLLCRLR
jgi:hypothetical protein